MSKARYGDRHPGGGALIARANILGLMSKPLREQVFALRRVGEEIERAELELARLNDLQALLWYRMRREFGLGAGQAATLATGVHRTSSWSKMYERGEVVNAHQEAVQDQQDA